MKKKPQKIIDNMKLFYKINNLKLYVDAFIYILYSSWMFIFHRYNNKYVYIIYLMNIIILYRISWIQKERKGKLNIGFRVIVTSDGRSRME